MRREQVLAILYEMAIVIGRETRVKPLLTTALQHLLFHTSFPCGLVFLDAPPERAAGGGDPLDLRLDLAIGDFELCRVEGTVVRVPGALVRGGAEQGERPDLLDALPCRKGHYRAFLRLPIDTRGVILLIGPQTPASPFPLTRIFEPVLHNLARAVDLCRSSEAYTRSLERDRARAEAAYQDLSQRSALILESVGEGICGVDLDGNATFVNPAAAHLLGYEPEELAGRPLHQIVHRREDGGEMPPGGCAILRAMREGRRHRTDEEFFLRKDGAAIAVDYVCTPLVEGDRGVGAVVVFQDITERRRDETALRELVLERSQHLERLHQVAVDTVQAIAAIVELRDPYTAGHQKRVAQLAVAISRELGVPGERIEGIRFGSLIHDIGKVYVPAEFLNRPGKLTELELQVIKTHPEAGFGIVKHIDFPWPVAKMIHQHHEYLDGSGYPLGLQGTDIILEARILAVADAIEAMVSHRPYRPSRGLAVALDEVERYSGTFYDPEAVRSCVSLFREGRFAFS